MPRTWIITLNAIGVLGISLVLLFAFIDQLLLADLPCPLCLLQRVAFVLAGFGLALNLRFGPQPRYYALTLVAALVGMMISGRQVMLHIAPGTGSYGEAVFGLHFYSWAFLLFGLIILGVAFLLYFHRAQVESAPDHTTDGPWLIKLAVIAFWAIAIISLANGVSTFLECGLGLCPDDPAEYQLLSFAQTNISGINRPLGA